MCQSLAIGCSGVWDLAGVEDVAELLRGLVCLLADSLSSWAIRKALSGWVVCDAVVRVSGS